MLRKPHFTQFLRNRPQTTSAIQSNTSFYRPIFLKSFPTSSFFRGNSGNSGNTITFHLKTSAFATHPVVEYSIARAEQSLTSKDQLSPAILLHSIIVNLQFAVSAVAAFGNDPLFEGWVEIGIAKIDPKGIAPKFPKNAKGLIPVDNRWKLAEQIGHGVDCWQVIPPVTTSPNGKQSTPPTVYLLFGNNGH